MDASPPATRVRRARVLVPLLAVALLGAACGTDDNTTDGSTGTTSSGAGAKDQATLAGAGSTFVQPMLQEWVKRYRQVAPGVTVNYQGVGSGAGIQQLTAKTVDFAGSDVALKPEEQTASGGPGAVVEIPWIAGGIAVEYNLPEVKDLKLSPEALAGIFAGRITRWNDAAIKADNASAKLPDTGIQVVHRSDGSGTTAVFTSYLTAVAPTVWTFGARKDPAWPVGTGAKGSDQVTASVKQAPGAIGYAEVSFPRQAGLGTAMVRNQGGSFVAPTATSVQAALGAATVNPDLSLKLDYQTTDAAAYPISTTTYVMFYKAGDAAKTAALKHFVAWALTDGQKAAEAIDYAPMPQAILDQALAVVRA